MTDAQPTLISSLSEAEIAEIRAEVSHYEYPQAASIEALKVVQKYRGWVSDESLRAVAKLLEMSAEQLDGVATFYSLIFRRPVGENMLMLCDGISCWMLGCEQVKARIQERLGIDYGETSPDNKFTLLPVTCQGACDRAPVLLKNMQLYTHLSAAGIDALLADTAAEQNS
ncbi:NADH-quinone oxidoreductase subunit NuoE [Exilibacterium tricleocarpae]|uniref:NADH-quinone oxidoreductase subunit E n=1 Tax=Exilibacterium tricleocarpae TaxID=2591008 RepID=A0A545T1W3_9GAMM|nr:NADH-quinone oxidoreductase subunit NuoE [Exilibacterium tricleocarpae]TQV71185.1 NADH-quinone oxidoreductase subunit NuoE [Exilibacterium tricleocarpae]